MDRSGSIFGEKIREAFFLGCGVTAGGGTRDMVDWIETIVVALFSIDTSTGRYDTILAWTRS